MLSLWVMNMPAMAEHIRVTSLIYMYHVQGVKNLRGPEILVVAEGGSLTHVLQLHPNHTTV